MITFRSYDAFLISDLASGGDLDAHSAACSLDKIRQLMNQLLSGLQYLQECWVWHRDIKPQNLLLDGDGRLKICDFGLSRSAFAPYMDGDDVCQQYTGGVVTPCFRAPEVVLRGGAYDGARVDMWSVGCVFGELLRQRDKRELLPSEGGDAPLSPQPGDGELIGQGVDGSRATNGTNFGSTRRSSERGGRFASSHRGNADTGSRGGDCDTGSHINGDATRASPSPSHAPSPSPSPPPLPFSRPPERLFVLPPCVAVAPPGSTASGTPMPAPSERHLAPDGDGNQQDSTRGGPPFASGTGSISVHAKCRPPSPVIHVGPSHVEPTRVAGCSIPASRQPRISGTHHGVLVHSKSNTLDRDAHSDQSAAWEGADNLACGAAPPGPPACPASCASTATAITHAVPPSATVATTLAVFPSTTTATAHAVQASRTSVTVVFSDTASAPLPSAAASSPSGTSPESASYGLACERTPPSPSLPRLASSPEAAHLRAVLELVGPLSLDDVDALAPRGEWRPFMRSLAKQDVCPGGALTARVEHPPADALDLLTRMLALDPRRRCCPQEALAHPFFATLATRHASRAGVKAGACAAIAPPVGCAAAASSAAPSSTSSGRRGTSQESGPPVSEHEKGNQSTMAPAPIVSPAKRSAQRGQPTCYGCGRTSQQELGTSVFARMCGDAAAGSRRFWEVRDPATALAMLEVELAQLEGMDEGDVLRRLLWLMEQEVAAAGPWGGEGEDAAAATVVTSASARDLISCADHDSPMVVGPCCHTPAVPRKGCSHTSAARMDGGTHRPVLQTNGTLFWRREGDAAGPSPSASPRPRMIGPCSGARDVQAVSVYASNQGCWPEANPTEGLPSCGGDKRQHDRDIVPGKAASSTGEVDDVGDCQAAVDAASHGDNEEQEEGRSRRGMTDGTLSRTTSSSWRGEPLPRVLRATRRARRHSMRGQAGTGKLPGTGQHRHTHHHADNQHLPHDHHVDHHQQHRCAPCRLSKAVVDMMPPPSPVGLEASTSGCASKTSSSTQLAVARARCQHVAADVATAGGSPMSMSGPLNGGKKRTLPGASQDRKHRRAAGIDLVPQPFTGVPTHCAKRGHHVLHQHPP
eukprot:jgi/Mesvir1/5031/Mv02238-RA.1